MLLHDFDFLAGTGGSYTGVAIYFNNKLQFVVDAQGYSYVRYVGLVEGATITKGCNSSQTVAPEMKN